MSELYSGRLVWTPQRRGSTQTDHFLSVVNQRHNLRIRNYSELHAYSVNPCTASDFWVDLFVFLKIKADVVPVLGYIQNTDFHSLLEDAGTLFPPPSFFPQIRLNFAENLLAGKVKEEIAIHACNEGGMNLRSVTWEELLSMVRQAADAMASFGIRIGDRVAAVISNRPETMALCLAALSLGAIWSTSSPDMGEQGILDRLLQIRPKLVFGETAVFYNGQMRDLRAKHGNCAAKLADTSEFQRYILLEQEGFLFNEHSQNAMVVTWSNFVDQGKGRELNFVQLPFSHPGFIVYSSGTTGPPKCIVHSAAGLLLQVKKDSILGFDVHDGDVLLQYTTTGWIMWAMVLCGLAYGGEVVVYDGSPLKPDKLALLRLVEKLKVTLLGTSARYLSDLKAANICPRETLDLSSLRTVTSTGSTLAADICEWFYDKGFPKHIHLASTSGGTDLACSLVSGNPMLPVHSGEIQCESLGMAVGVADLSKQSFRSVKEKGEPGELVCTMPFPSQPSSFWGQDGAKRYQASYFERFGTRVWNQGDFVQMNVRTGGYLMLGRSDGVLNPSGVRFGSAEIYDVVEKFSEIDDSICVGQRRATDTDESVILFVKMKGNIELHDDMKERLRQAIKSAHSPRHVPKHILQVPEIPYTINGKKIEIAVKQIISGKKVTPSGTVANPHCFKLYEKFVNIDDILRRSGPGARAKL
ncbi:acetoacetate-CoA ligase [Cladophialophora psammophila CBS 110553]|uniref:Acetoacetate-CoA ligase n=1 Tax=Cladophialophora psammophila CBS 110553 TaxID=1182543 RepID=W9XH56_9EURO|nr:acetoacetate-CoA ligase [Cladophialophora psammophila CBS 110553]EXJ76281.1 acetoacetate-CoA ligase [Cladophialophora psammophila CBS 110553]